MKTNFTVIHDNRIHTICLVVLLFARGISAQASLVLEASCDCDHTISKATTVVNGDSIAPGDIVCLEGGIRKELRFNNLQGTATDPIVIVGHGERVVINTTANYGILFVNSKHFQLSGRNDEEEYGIAIEKTGLMGVNATGLSSHFEINNIEISHVGFAGIIAKTDPSCSFPDLRHFVMEGVELHHNYIHDVEGEGIYVGYSWYPKRQLKCSGITTDLYPHRVENLNIHHNVIHRSGWDGIQVGSATTEVKVHHNDIDTYGLGKVSGQDNGMQVGAGTTGHWYNNKILHGQGVGGNGIIDIGIGNTTLYNNLIVDTKGNGIYTNDKNHSDPTVYYRAFNNTIVNTGSNGIHFSITHTDRTKNMLANNIVVNPGRSYFSASPSKVSLMNNTGAAHADELFFADRESGDYSLTEDSPAMDTGIDLKTYGVTFDLEDNLRDADKNPFDRGAYEANFSKVMGAPLSEVVLLYPNPTIESFTLSVEKENTKVFLYDRMGQLVLCRMMVSTTDHIDLRGYGSGVYFLKIDGYGEKIKIIKNQ